MVQKWSTLPALFLRFLSTRLLRRVEVLLLETIPKQNRRNWESWEDWLGDAEPFSGIKEDFSEIKFRHGFLADGSALNYKERVGLEEKDSVGVASEPGTLQSLGWQ